MVRFILKCILIFYLFGTIDVDSLIYKLGHVDLIKLIYQPQKKLIYTPTIFWSEGGTI